MTFENRETTNSNRKNLHVLEVNYNPNTGELANLEVEETSNEGTVIQEGTKLNASNLNSAMEAYTRNKFLHFYYKEAVGIIISENDYTIELTGNVAKTISISYDGALYPVVRNDIYVNVGLNSSYTSLTIQRKAIYQSDPGSGIIYVDYYKESSHSHLVCVLNIKYTYTPSSTNPLD